MSEGAAEERTESEDRTRSALGIPGHNGGGLLIPPQPGEVRNPAGRNQYTYRKAWEREIDVALNSAADGERETTLQAIADKLLREAKKGAPWAMQLVLKRVWPEVQRHEVSAAGAAPPSFNPLESLDAEDRATMLRLAQKAIRGSE